MPRQRRNNPDLSPGSLRLLVAAFFTLGLLQILNHPLWQDEWQAWLISRDSGSLAELFRHLRYEGHPALWFLVLFGLSRLTAQPLAMQLLHLALATATVYIFLRFSPFTRLQKILFAFGYFPFFEYAVISRNYAAGICLIFSYGAVFPRDFPGRRLVLAGLLFLLCQTSVYGVLVALALAAAMIFGELTGDSAHPSRRPSEPAAAAAIIIAGVGIAVWQLLPPPDSGFAVDWRLHLDWPAVLRTMGLIWDSYVPLPSLQVQFWNTNLIGNPYLKFFLALLLLAVSFLLLSRQPAALLLFSLGALAILSFTYTKYPGSLRHHGHLFILLVASLWLSAYEPARWRKPGDIHRLDDFLEQRRQGLITALFSAQLAAGLLAAGMALSCPFSAGKETAGYIKERGLADMLIAGDEDDAASVVSGYLNRPIFYLGSNRWGTFVIWDQQRQILEVPEILHRARELAARRRQEVLLVLNREVQTPEPELTLIRQFPRSIVPAEVFYLYLQKPTGEPQAP